MSDVFLGKLQNIIGFCVFLFTLIFFIGRNEGAEHGKSLTLFHSVLLSRT